MSEMRDTLRDTLVALPLYGAALGVTYDVGFFYGIGIDYFTLFSLPEHIVFALQAAPVALLVAFGIFYLVALFNLGTQVIIPTVPAFLLRAGRDIGPWVLMLLLLIPGILFLQRGDYFFGTCSVVLFLITLNTSAPVAFPRRVVFGLSVAAGLLGVTFVLGIQNAISIWERNTATHSIVLSGRMAAVEGHLIRSGERGVLFLDTSTKTIEFILWKEITTIQSLKLEGRPPASS
jgi:hypothetical protein